MKFLQPVLKLMFVGMLACLILSQPHSARASGTEYQCDAQWTQDYANLTEWMNQCMVCTHQGTPNDQVCYWIDYPTVVNGQTNGFSDYYTCNDINESAQACVNNCVDGFNQQFEGYFNADCSPI